MTAALWTVLLALTALAAPPGAAAPADPAAEAASRRAAIAAAAETAGWQRLDEGLAFRRIAVADPAITVLAWSFDPARWRFDVARQRRARGAAAAEIRAAEAAVLAVNGGFFEVDAEERLSPSGLLVIDGRRVHPYRKGAGSGVLAVTDGIPTIGWSGGPVPEGTEAAVQAGPLLVEPGGRHGINTDGRRADRTAVCLTGGHAVVVVAEGAVSLHELATLLARPAAAGGFGCERALNLDGGTSTQASFRLGDAAWLEVEARRRVHDFVVVRRR